MLFLCDTLKLNKIFNNNIKSLRSYKSDNKKNQLINYFSQVKNNKNDD